uniref:(northern house mosquito) hypothetical protein n=1 Tax=Culex pipiens TaxID=7175 RepID=A0A8D8CFM9_CULPI
MCSAPHKHKPTLLDVSFPIPAQSDLIASLFLTTLHAKRECVELYFFLHDFNRRLRMHPGLNCYPDQQTFTKWLQALRVSRSSKRPSATKRYGTDSSNGISEVRRSAWTTRTSWQG